MAIAKILSCQLSSSCPFIIIVQVCQWLIIHCWLFSDKMLSRFRLAIEAVGKFVWQPISSHLVPYSTGAAIRKSIIVFILTRNVVQVQAGNYNSLRVSSWQPAQIQPPLTVVKVWQLRIYLKTIFFTEIKYQCVAQVQAGNVVCECLWQSDQILWALTVVKVWQLNILFFNYSLNDLSVVQVQAGNWMFLWGPQWQRCLLLQVLENRNLNKWQQFH